MIDPELDQQALAVRTFGRFYTRQIGLVQDGYLDSPFSLSQVRVLYELAHQGSTTAGALARELGLDPGYLSRMLRGFDGLGLLDRRPSEVDGRSTVLALSQRGREVFEPLEERSQLEIKQLLGRLPARDRRRVVESMATIQRLLGQPAAAAPYVLRPPRPGDMGWVVSRQGALYAEEYGWDETFEALVAEIVAAFVRRFDPTGERCWIAEVDGRNAGCVFCVRKSKTVAQLRLLIVEPDARGLGIGRRLVDECLAFARSKGYRQTVLWTNDILVSARRIYEAAGFELVDEERHHSFGRELVGQNWALKL